MRIRVTESALGESDDIMRRAEDAGHTVLRCQPRDATVLPLLTSREPGRVSAMRVLVVEGRMGDSVPDVADLISGGFAVVRCQPLDQDVRPCVGLVGLDTCPLEKGPVDLVVDIRAPEQIGDGPRELGLVCARRLGIPVVTIPPE